MEIKINLTLYYYHESLIVQLHGIEQDQWIKKQKALENIEILEIRGKWRNGRGTVGPNFYDFDLWDGEIWGLTSVVSLVAATSQPPIIAHTVTS